MPRFMNEDDRPDEGGESRHAIARQLAEAGLRAERAGDQAHADHLFDEAERTDPAALETVLRDNPVPRRRLSGQGFGDDAGVARMSRTVEPDADPPSRAGITQAGSGADSERR